MLINLAGQLKVKSSQPAIMLLRVAASALAWFHLARSLQQKSLVMDIAC